MDTMNSSIIVGLIFAISTLITIFFILVKPKIQISLKSSAINLETYYFGALLSPLLLICFQYISFPQIKSILQGTPSFSPIGILILFLSMVFMSLFLDTTGFFHYFALLAIKVAKNNSKVLFFSLYATVALLTIFTSNDIVILTFTPIIFYFTKTVKLDPKPFLFAEFFAANTWSMFLFIGNPTNILLASAFNVKFGEYFRYMFLPTIMAGISSALILYIIFRKNFSQNFESYVDQSPNDVLTDKIGAKIGVGILFITIVLLSISPYFNFIIWYPAFGMAGILLIYMLIRGFWKKKGRIEKSKTDLTISEIKPLLIIAKKMPWAVVPFILSLFITIGALDYYGVSLKIVEILSFLTGDSEMKTIFIFGIFSGITANILNNIPMSVLLVSVIQNISPLQINPALFATVIGSNLGALFTPIGALAGIMWLTMLKGRKFSLTVREFMKICALHTPIVLIFSLLGLYLSFI